MTDRGPSVDFDVLVAGAGPAGLSLAGALASRGLKVACADPAVARRWENNICAWADEIEPLGFEPGCYHVWPDSRVIFDERSSKLLGRAYIRFDNDRLKEALLDDRVVTIERRVVEAQHDYRGSRLMLQGGESVRATVVVDATGHDHGLLRARREADTFQNVYGVLAKVDGHPFASNEMILMDFRAGFLGRDAYPPTFLYCMPYGPDRAFFEETSLADSPGVPFEVLESRLSRRLDSLGVTVREVESVEAGALAMNLSAPDPGGRAIGFGAAGGFVHPATGWSVSHSMRMASPVAESIASSLRAGMPPGDVSRAAHAVMWPPALLRMRKVHLMGGAFFTRVDIRTLSWFMRAFFNAPGGMMWREYLSNDCTVSRLNRSLVPSRAAGGSIAMTGR